MRKTGKEVCLSSDPPFGTMLVPRSAVPPGAGSQRAAPRGGAVACGVPLAGSTGAALAAEMAATSEWGSGPIWRFLTNSRTKQKQLRRFQTHETQSQRTKLRNEKQSVHAETECTSSRIVEKRTGLKAPLYPNSKVMRYTDLQAST